jgi:hypothetical protein
MINGKDRPELEYTSDFGYVVVHEKLKRVKGRDVKCQ